MKGKLFVIVSCVSKCSCDNKSVPTCSELCAYKCQKNFNSITPSCIQDCGCPCEEDCATICDYYGLGDKCKFSCGCLSDFNITKVENLLYVGSTLQSGEKCLTNCAIDSQGSISKMGQCMIKCALGDKSKETVGCILQCAVGNWNNPLAFTICVYNCANDTTPVLMKKEILMQKYKTSKVVFMTICIAVIASLILAAIFVTYTKNKKMKKVINDPSVVEYEPPIIDDE